MISISVCKAGSRQVIPNDTDGVARQLLGKFAGGDKKGVIVMDFACVRRVHLVWTLARRPARVVPRKSKTSSRIGR